MADLSFIPFMRRGLATGITTSEQAAAASGAESSSFKVHVDMGATWGATDVDVGLIGPGEITGVDARAVVRVTPGRDESDAEFKHFAAIEFDQADVPWRYTPFAKAGDQLRPWMVLIVLSETAAEFQVAAPTATQKLTVVTVNAGVKLPPLSSSWAWAHVQFHGTPISATPTAADKAALETVLRTTPGLAVARLLCPRVLAAQTAYRAFLVPAFERGRRVGLGQDLSGAGLTVASWPLDGVPTAPIELPVYYDWRFQTGTVGKFEDLVRALQPQALPSTVGQRAIDVSVPGYKLPSAAGTGVGAGTALAIGGALRPFGAAPVPTTLPGVTTNLPDPGFVSELAAFMSASTRALDTSVPRLVVAPPLYGRWHAAQTRLDQPTNPPWFFQLDSDPRNRVGAALGTSVIQQEQQDLMASAWRQLGGLKPANDERRVLQVGRETFLRLFNRHLTSGFAETFLLMTRALHARVRNGTTSGAPTVHATLDGSRVGRDLFGAQWRRFVRPRGALGRRQGRHIDGTPLAPIQKLIDGFDPAPEPPPPLGAATTDIVFGDLPPGGGGQTQIDTLAAQGNDALLFWGILLFCVSRRFLALGAGNSWWWLLRVMRFALGLIRLANGRAAIDLRRKLRDGTLDPGTVSGAPKVPTFSAVPDLPSPLPAVPPTGATDSTDATNFRGALVDIITDFANPRPPLPVLPTNVTVPGLFGTMSGALDPRLTLLASWLKRFTFLNGTPPLPADNLEPIQAAPEFPQPMWAPLRDLSNLWIVPGLAQVTPNTVGLLVPNQPFIETYMVGLNHEMARELLWNEYPTDQRGSYFRQFWDTRGATVPAAGPEALRSIRAIHTWPATSSLGQNFPTGGDPGGMVVLLVRGELIRRYPNVIVYVADVDLVRDPTTQQVIGGQPKAGTEKFPIFSGSLGRDVAFYGFALDMTAAKGNPGQYFVLQEAPSEPRFDPPDGTPADTELTDGSASGAAFAVAHYQDLVRVAIHASTFTPPPST